MTKDKLSKYLFNLKELACKACSGEEEKCFSCGMKLGTILRILDYHFSISEQERKEAREAISKHVPKTGLGYFVGGSYHSPIIGPTGFCARQQLFSNVNVHISSSFQNREFLPFVRLNVVRTS